MANSKYAYVRTAERDDSLLPNTWLVARLDGKSFHRFAERHAFVRPNDRRALELMNAAARTVMSTADLGADIVAAFGESDEYSFVFARRCSVFKRRESKILSTLVSVFTSAYVRQWPRFFPNGPLDVDDEGPSFDGRIVQYATDQEIVDYLKWRQVDTHINNLYNTTFWALIQQGGLTAKVAHAELSGTVSSQKHDILHQRFGINYNDLDPMFKRGSLLVRLPAAADASSAKASSAPKLSVVLLHDDLLKGAWWSTPPGLAILSGGVVAR